MLNKIKSKFKDGSLRSLLINLGVIVVIIIVLQLLFFFVYLPNSTNHGETLTVPDLEGMKLEDMEEFLESKHLKFEVSDSGYASKYPPLTILKQFPMAGAQVKENRKIYLTVQAKQPKAVKMPNLIDGSLKNAELVLKNYGLKRGEIQYKPDLANNAILEQLYKGKPIKSGTNILIGSVIDLVVGDGLGNRIINAPNLLGLDLEEAAFSIKGSGLNTGSVIVEVIDEDEMLSLIEKAEEIGVDPETINKSGHVFKQRPEVDSEVHLGEQIDLWVVSLDPKDSMEVLFKWQNRDQELDNGSDENND